MQENFIRLLNAQFVERCPAPEPFLAPPGDEETSAKKRGAKSAKVVAVTTNKCKLFVLYIFVLVYKYYQTCFRFPDDVFNSEIYIFFVVKGLKLKINSTFL